jgi:hypothetical protein
MEWFNTDSIDSLTEQLADMAQANGTHTQALAKIDAGTACVVITKYHGANDNEEITRVMAPVMSQGVAYNRDVNPDTGKAYGMQSVGDFLAFHENKSGAWRFGAVCLTRHAEDPTDCGRQQRLDRIEKVLATRTSRGCFVLRVNHKSDSLTVRNRI